MIAGHKYACSSDRVAQVDLQKLGHYGCLYDLICQSLQSRMVGNQYKVENCLLHRHLPIFT